MAHQEMMMFPYYIVRFKPHRSPQSLHMQKEFPYYIVRFKPHSNSYPRFKLLSFHTTQYDLNSIGRLTGERIPTFPYYIVRFKLCSRPSVSSMRIQFPYYIVRFKLFQAPRVMRRVFCFHTTQYDLNRKNIITDDEKKESFHTTQYDLNGLHKIS